MEHEENKPLLDLLYHCAARCHHCATACLDEIDVKMLTKCIKLDMDCADICVLTASFIARNSRHANHLLAECAKLCNACADECEKHHHMEHCKRCAEACRACAKACMSVWA